MVLPDGPKNYNGFSRLDTIPACDRQTEVPTYGQTLSRSKDGTMVCGTGVKGAIVHCGSKKRANFGGL